MSRINWYLNRLRAMSVPEVAWRIAQRRLQQQERRRFGKRHVAVTDGCFNERLSALTFCADAVGLCFDNRSFTTTTAIHLLGGYDYETHRKQWHAGFQTDKQWPLELSYALRYKQRDEIGDARTNWELNRHFQLALLAKAYYATGEEKYLTELQELLDDWNKHNPFLHGISWTSVMEVAIRCVQWKMALAFLRKKGVDGEVCQQLQCGIVNMADYVAGHYSRFSSANNHVLVEATALAYAGYAFDYEPWKTLAVSILNHELMLQNYSDGVNKEMALHYQTFGMEAYALVMHLMQQHGEAVPEAWTMLMEKQCEFVATSMVSETTALEFGDNDEGKILDLAGGDVCHYRYLLQLCSLVLGKRYEAFNKISETIAWLFSEDEIAKVQQLPIYNKGVSRTFSEGGYTFWRSKDSRVIIGIDHAPLGFGSIAAHGHADALSFQLYVDGQCILGDPGTYIYHCQIEKRDYYRQSRHHSTVWTEQEEQSQMMGAFLWGKKAETEVLDATANPDGDMLNARCRWYGEAEHERTFQFDGKSSLSIDDCLRTTAQGFATIVVHPECEVSVEGNAVLVKRENMTVHIEVDSKPTIWDAVYSTAYGIECKSKEIVFTMNAKNKEEYKLNTKIWIEKY